MEVDSGAGSYAPRKRQAYTSKRLQQVVSDFRRERAKTQSQNAGSVAPSQDGDFAPEGETGPSKKRRKTTALNKRKKGLTGKVRQTKAETSGRRKDADATSAGEESMDDGECLPAGLIPSQPLSVQLRPRPGPDRKMDTSLAEHSSSSTDQLME